MILSYIYNECFFLSLHTQQHQFDINCSSSFGPCDLHLCTPKMIAQDEVLQHNNYTEFEHQDPYEAEETLSLCDLPTHSDSANWDDQNFSKDYDPTRSSSFDDEDNFFEFFSEDFTASTYPSDGKDIIFCGKLIPYKEFPEKKTQNNTNHQETNPKRITSSSSKKDIFRSWKSYSLNKTTTKCSSKSGKAMNSTTSKSSYVSVLSSTPSKSKWYLLMFGMARFPTEMELGDIKSRQSRRTPPTMFGSGCEGSDGLMGKDGQQRRSRAKAKGLWGMLRAVGSLGCSSQPNAVVKGASFS